MSELPVPVVTPPEPPAAQTLVCANCHAPLNGEYCATCGQRHEPHIHTVGHFVGEAFESISHADSRLWRTLWYLFSRPGFLTREFFAGRRVTYLPPFRLYLVLSVLFFVTIGLGGSGETPVDPLEKKPTAADVAELNQLADEVERGSLGSATDAARERVARQLRDAAAAQAAQLPDGQSASADAAPEASAATKPFKSKEIDIMTGEGVQEGIADFCKEFRSGTSGDPAQLTSDQRRVLRWCNRYDVEGFSAVGKTLAHNIPRAMFVFLPLLALCMKLLYWRPKRYYVEHLLFMVHNHAFVFLVSTVCMLIGLVPVVGDYVALLYWAAFFYMAWYIYRAMRNVYGQKRWLTVLKYLAMGFAYILAGATVFLLTFIYSTITL